MPLFVVSTPIGNLEEASPRLCRVLSDVDLVLCEDTRRTRTLFAALDLTAPKLVSCHAHNESGRLASITAQLQQGVSIALVSDAGSPGVSDPGRFIVEAAHAAEVPVHVVGGPSAVTAALSVSGLPGTPFHFLGFLPRKPGPMAKALIAASHLEGTLVFLESGRRVGDVIAKLAELLPDREAVLCRELTKKFEEILRGPVTALPTTEQRGEVVLVVGPGASFEPEQVELGPTLKHIAAALAERWDCKKSEAYAALVALEGER